jgi:hypothetical protein
MSTTTDNVSRIAGQIWSHLAGYKVGDKVAIAVGPAWYRGTVTKLTKTKVYVTYTKGTAHGDYVKAVDPYHYTVPSPRLINRASSPGWRTPAQVTDAPAPLGLRMVEYRQPRCTICARTQADDWAPGHEFDPEVRP